MIDTRDAPVEADWTTLRDRAGIRGLPNQFPEVPDTGVTYLARPVGMNSSGSARIDVAASPPLDVEYPNTDRRALSERAIADRRGQRAFRASSMEQYRGRCVITETDVADVLEAAHIHPYRGDHTDCIDNGLLLRTDIHTLFDLYKITVLPTGVARVHASLHDTDYDVDQRRLQFPVAEANRPNVELLWHNERCSWLTRV